MNKNTAINWNYKHFSELSTLEWYAIAKKRMEVFIMEQDCHYLDLDDKDQEAYHIYAVENNEVIAYARLLGKGVSYPQVSIGRVLVVESARGKNLGHLLMDNTMNFSVNIYGKNNIKISAQEHLIRFYEAHGFKVVTEMYLEDDIPHVGMLFQ
jgi:ElaA protein